MLDILLLIIFGKNIADIAEEKGLMKSNWIGILVIGWFSCLICFGILSAILLALHSPDENILIPSLVVAYFSAFVWFICLRFYLKFMGGNKIYTDHEVDDHLISEQE